MALSRCAQRQEIGHQIIYLVWQAQIGLLAVKAHSSSNVFLVGSMFGSAYVWLLCFAISWYSRFVALESGSQTVVLPDFAVEV